MLIARLDVLRLLTTLTFFFGASSAIYAVGWSDDFNDGSVTDGNPVTWEQNLLGFFPGNYDASSGDYSMSAPGGGNNNQLVSWVSGVNFTDSYIRAQGIVLPGNLPEETGGNLALLGRLDTSTVSAYVLYIDSGGQLGLQISLGGTLVDLVEPVTLPGLEAISDVIIELDIVGDQLSGFAWRPGDPKPAIPQIAATDVTLAAGEAGIAYDEDDDNTIGLFRFAAAQDMPFMEAFLPGDYNNNGQVDAADYTVWRDTDGSTTDLRADGDDTGASMGVIDEADFDFWAANFGAAGAGSRTTAVPEPAGIVLMLIALATSLRSRPIHSRPIPGRLKQRSAPS